MFAQYWGDFLNTNKVKNIVLILLVALNVSLFGLIQLENSRFRLSAAQETAIRELFAANNIEITTTIPRNFRPMRGLYVQPFRHDIHEHGARFFPNETPEFVPLWNSETLQVGERTLTLDNTYLGDYVLLYNYEPGHSTPEFLERGFTDVYAGRALVDEFIRTMAPPGLDFIFNYAAWDEDSFLFEYRGYFMGYIISDNFISVRIMENGIVGARFLFAGIPYEFSSEAREIFSADEALFTVFQDTLHRYADSEVVVVRIQLAYYLAGGMANADGITKAVPCYKISVEIDGRTRLFWVDAYTSELLDIR